MCCFCVTYDYYAACPTLWFVSVHVPGSGVTWPGTRSRCPSLGWRSNCSNVERHPTLLLREDDDISAHLLKYSIHTAKTNLNKSVNSQLIKLPPINLLSITLQLSILEDFRSNRELYFRSDLLRGTALYEGINSAAKVVPLTLLS